MTEHASKRFTVVAGGIAIVAALYGILKGSGPPAIIQGATVSPSGGVSDPVLFDVPGSPDAVADPEDPTAAAVASVTGAAAGSGVAASGDPSTSAATAYLYYNLPPARITREAAAAHGCGCGGGGGCAGGGCSNKPPSNVYVDGRGNCLSSTESTLQSSIEACIPGYTQRAYENLAAAAAHWGNDFDVASRAAYLPDIPVWN